MAAHGITPVPVPVDGLEACALLPQRPEELAGLSEAIGTLLALPVLPKPQSKLHAQLHIALVLLHLLPRYLVTPDVTPLRIKLLAVVLDLEERNKPRPPQAWNIGVFSLLVHIIEKTCRTPARRFHNLYRVGNARNTAVDTRKHLLRLLLLCLLPVGHLGEMRTLQVGASQGVVSFVRTDADHAASHLLTLAVGNDKVILATLIAG